MEWSRIPFVLFLLLILVERYNARKKKLKHKKLSVRDITVSDSVDNKNHACSVKPEYHICQYRLIKWQREYRWRAYYEPKDNECYYFRGCPNTNKALFNFDVDCRKACVHEDNRKLKFSTSIQTKPDLCSKRPRYLKGCPTKQKQKKVWFDPSISKCRFFNICKSKDKRYWNSLDDCYAACTRPFGSKNPRLLAYGLID